VSSAVGFVIGFAMFGAIVFLPLFLQDVRGVSPTLSGLQILPLMGGLLITSIASGQIISRVGRYRIFPIVGCAVTTVGLFLLHLVNLSTGTFVFSVYMFILGAGIGAVMQVLVLAVQNSVPHDQLGVATSGATFFRSMGGSFGTAIFGAIFANELTGKLHHYLAGVKLPSTLSSTSVSPEILAHLPSLIRHGYQLAFASSLSVVFLVAVPFGLVAFLLSLLLPEVHLRTGNDDVIPSAESAAAEAQVVPPGPLAE
jgi:MFS family permease